MIQRALEYLTDEIAFGLGLDTSELSLNELQALGEKRGQGMIIALLNVEEEYLLKNRPHHFVKSNQQNYREPAVYLNLNMLFAFDFEHYTSSLRYLSDTVDFFQSRRLFSTEKARAENPFPEHLGKLIVDLQKLNLEQLNHIWSIAGGSHFLSLSYRIRMLKIQSADDQPAPEVQTVRIDPERIV